MSAQQPTTIAVRRRTRTVWYVLGLCGAVALMLTGMAVTQRASESSDKKVPVRAPELVVRGVGALGTLEPRTRVVRLSAPTSAEGTRVDQLFVAEGDWVEAGAVVASLDTLPRCEAAYQEANARVAVAQARLEQVKAGSKAGDIAAFEAGLSRCRADLKNAERELARAEQLLSKKGITPEEIEKRRHDCEVSRFEVARAEGLLASAREVRDVDVRHAEAEVQSALAAVKRAKVEVDAAQVQAPFSGRILKVVTRPGEQVGGGGIVEIGDTSEMHAVAEVYEADVSRVRVGQSARVRVPSLGIEFSGNVVLLGQRVGRKVVFDNDPVSDTDARVVEVRIRLDVEASRQVAGLSNARVQVVIEPNYSPQGRD